MRGGMLVVSRPNTNPGKLDTLVWHISGGMFVLVLMILHVIVRIWSARPTMATTGTHMLDRRASIAHHIFY